MIRFDFSPEWFYGIDSLIEIFSIIVLLITGFYAYKFYKFSKQRNYKFFSLAFFMLALGFVFKILTNITIYSEVLEKIKVGTLTIVQSTVHEYEFFYILGYLGFRMLFLLALMGLYMVSYKETNLRDMLLFGYLFLVVCIFSHWKYIFFHITAAFILAFIVYYYIDLFFKKKNKSTLLVGVSFLFMFVSQVLFAITYYDINYYVAGEIIQLLAFAVLLSAMIKVMKR